MNAVSPTNYHSCDVDPGGTCAVVVGNARPRVQRRRTGLLAQVSAAAMRLHGEPCNLVTLRTPRLAKADLDKVKVLSTLAAAPGGWSLDQKVAGVMEQLNKMKQQAPSYIQCQIVVTNEGTRTHGRQRVCMNYGYDAGGIME